MREFAANVGRGGIETIRKLGGMGYLLLDSFRWAFVGPWQGYRFRWKATFFQMVRVGVRSIPITALVLAVVGMILALQMAYVLKTFGVMQHVATVVGIATTRELGPLLTAILLSGYAGAAIAAELGTMKVAEEILALETSALNPIWFLVAPRVIATMVMIPALTAIANMIGILGGMLIGTAVLDMSPGFYIDRTIEALKNKDIITGLLKSEAFAIVISTIACYQGLSVDGGAEGVGKATTSTVVNCIVSIIIVDCIFTAMFYTYNL
ncbi:MAG: ABC transporter permease [Planctomycetota bacterium]